MFCLVIAGMCCRRLLGGSFRRVLSLTGTRSWLCWSGSAEVMHLATRACPIGDLFHKDATKL
jgi:hypothetical protein